MEPLFVVIKLNFNGSYHLLRGLSLFGFEGDPVPKRIKGIVETKVSMPLLDKQNDGMRAS